MNEIQFLGPELLSDQKKVQEIDYWLSVLNWVTGWHYDLDIIFTLRNIEKLNLPKGATILDAGAGLGITQFILAARGYNILSLDFAPREIPASTVGIFNVEQVNRNLDNYHHSYMDFMVYKDHKQLGLSGRFNHSLRIISSPKQIIYRFGYYFKKLKSKVMRQIELRKDHSGFGKISFIRGTFNQIPVLTNSVDLIVSISAFEHNKFEDMPGSVAEFERVLKPGAAMLVTTSAAKNDSHFHEPSQGWCISIDKFKNMFACDQVKGDYISAEEKLKTSDSFRRRIPSAYKMSGDNGLPFGQLSNIQYVPVGIIKSKNQRL